MGSGRFNNDSWSSLSATRSTLSRDQIFQRDAKNEFLPHSLKGGLRESIDSVDNPVSRPIIVFMDATGSMGHIPQYMATVGIGEVMANILEYKPVEDPHVMIGIFTDAKGDYNPLQVAQFEADNRIAEQAVQFSLGGGGASDSESYDYPWLFAATMTKTDAWDKRGQKGYLFTMGDEPAPRRTNTVNELRCVFGDKFNREYTSDEMLQMAREKWIVFHIVIEDGSRGKTSETKRTWKEMMGPNCLFLDNHKFLAQLITATIAYSEGVIPMEQILENAGVAKDSVQRAFSMLQEYA